MIKVKDGRKVRTHNRRDCMGERCCLHNPSKHHMRDWPLFLRTDRRYPLAERFCSHGVGHPDPDSLRWIYKKMIDQGYSRREATSEGIHGCDGCCGKTFEKAKKQRKGGK